MSGGKMKKSLFSLFVVVVSMFLILPSSARANPDVYYDLGDGSKLYIVATVCKVADCINTGAPTDWKDYSTTSENVVGDAGSAQTLVVSPGDTLYFLGATRIVGDAVLDPIYGFEFTNGSYLTVDQAFGSVIDEVDYSDIDNDNNSFWLASESSIDLTGGLSGAMESQIDAITARVNSNAPDGTLITGIFYVVDPDRLWLTFGPNRAMAADGDTFIRSEVRMLVSNPAPAQATPVAAALPATGGSSRSQAPYLLLLASIVLSLGIFYVMKSAKK